MSEHTTQDPTQEIPYGYCHCGCGEKTRLSPRNHTKRGYVKGEPYKYIAGHADIHRANISLDERFWNHVNPSSAEECWEWQGAPTPCGYGRLRCGIHSNSTNVPAHRVSWEIHFGPIPDGLFVCHICDNPICVNPAHLFLGTAVDNVADMDAKGRRGTYDHTRSSPLTANDVREIRRRFAIGERQAVMAIEYGVSPNTVHRIVRSKTWKHV